MLRKSLAAAFRQAPFYPKLSQELLQTLPDLIYSFLKNLHFLFSMYLRRLFNQVNHYYYYYY